jgi:hypothetical protein
MILTHQTKDTTGFSNQGFTAAIAETKLAVTIPVLVNDLNLSTVEDVTEKLKNETGEIHFQHLS